MSIDLSRFFDEDISSIPIRESLNFESIDFDGRNIEFVEPIKVIGNIYRVGQDKYLDVEINYSYRESCGRCLESFTKSQTTGLSGKLTDDTDEDSEEELVYYDGEILDLTSDVRSMVLLDLPMKPICKDDCQGLCPVCGIDKNKEDCDCVVDTVDPRLAKLKDFFPED